MIGNVLHTLCHAHPPAHLQAATEIVDSALATAMHAARASIHRALRVSPGALVFGRDMFLDIPIIANLALIRQRRQVLIDENACRENLQRRSKDYQPGDHVMVVNPEATKLSDQLFGPFHIVQVHVNGTVTIQKNPLVRERIINIRRLRPVQP